MALYYMLNKPRGCVTARVDDRYPTVMPCFPEPLRSALHPVGRLDMDTEGFLLFTDDGALDNHLMQPGCHVEKTYFFWALGELDGEKIRRLEQGITLRRGNFTTQPAAVTVEARATVAAIRDLLPEREKLRYLRNPSGAAVSGTLTIREGKWHQVKRMLKSVNCQVVYLKRISLGGIALDPLLSPGQYRKLTPEEETILTAAKKRTYGTKDRCSLPGSAGSPPASGKTGDA